MSEADHDKVERDDQDDDQQEQTRTSRETGGDAEAAAPIEDREAVATDTDDPRGDRTRE
jgi:hypothetical protein